MSLALLLNWTSLSIQAGFIAFLSAPVATLESVAKSVVELIGQSAKDNRPVSNWLQVIVDESLKKKSPVVVHCSAGLGRTGTMLASYLVQRGSNTAEALAQVRKRRPGSVETADQELAVCDYEVYMNTKSVSG